MSAIPPLLIIILLCAGFGGFIAHRRAEPVEAIALNAARWAIAGLILTIAIAIGYDWSGL